MNKEKIERTFENVAHSQTFQNIVRAHNLGDKKVLDIGCAYGEFLAHFGKGSLGITIVDEETQYAQKEKGLNVITGNIEDPDFSLNETFDVIFANNLFEHMYSPHNFLIKIKKNLKPGGILILGVPAVPKIVSLLHVQKFRGSLASNHINFFTHYTLIKTVERAGWDVSTCRSFHFSNILLDTLLRPIVPHFYVVATADEGFEYPWKRQKEVDGYKGTQYEG